MYNRILILTAVILAAIFLPSAGAKAQPNVPILTVDTLTYLGKTENREAKGAFFLPDGNIIAVWGDTPLIIDSKSGDILRRLDSLPKKNVSIPKVSQNGKYLIAYSDNGSVIWDIPSGKIVKYIQVANDYCFSPDGLKMYCTNSTSSQKPGIIRVYDMITLEEIERISLGNFITAYHISISPDGQTLAVSVYRKEIHEWDTKTNQVILIDLKNNNNYKVIEELEPSVYSMEFSPDGKQIAFVYYGTSSNLYIYIYNLETKVKNYIYQKDLLKLSLFNEIGIGKPYFLDNNTILFEIGDIPKFGYSSFIWKINESSLYKFINWYPNSVDVKNKSILLSTSQGALSILDSEYVSVSENKTNNEISLFYRNRQIEYNSDKSFIGQSIIYDTTGKVIINLGIQPIVVGNNLIRINKNLPVGVYILTIKNGTEQISKKFLVEN